MGELRVGAVVPEVLYSPDPHQVEVGAVVVEVLYSQKAVYAQAATFRNGGEDEAIPLLGDRSAFWATAYPAYHSDGLAAAAPQYHVPLPGTARNVAISTGDMWESRALIAADIPAEYVRLDGTLPLTADWDAGPYKITALTFESDVAIGAAPLIVTSTTVVTNLNADRLDGQHGAWYAPASAIAGTAGRVAMFGAGGDTVVDSFLVGPAANLLTLAAGGAYTLTVPDTGTVAMLAIPNVFTTTQTITPGAAVTGLIINTAASSIGAIFRANATTPGSITEWQAFGGGVLSSISGVGDWGLGIAPASNAGIKVFKLHTNPAGTNYGGYIQAYTTRSSAGSQIIYGLRLFTDYDSTYADSGVYIGVLGNVRNLNTGILTTGIGQDIIVNASGGQISVGYGIRTSIKSTVGTMTLARSVYIQSNTGTIINNYGIYIDNQSAGTNNYAIYTNAGLVYFGDRVGVSEPNPDAQFHVTVSGAAVIGQVIQLHSSPSENALEVWASDDTVLSALTFTGGAEFSGVVTVGDGTNQLVISAGGVLTLEGTAQRVLAIRPEIDYVTQIAHAKPTQETRGVYKLYSFPVYAADDEQLIFHANVPGRWNGSSDITFHVLCALGGAEDVGDYFKFRLSWESTHAGEVVPATSHAVDVEQIVLVGRNAAYDEYELMFTIDWDADGGGNEVLNHDLLGATLYRVDATNPDVSNEIKVLDYHLHYPVDKMFAAA